jgi:hypothetical protein
MMIANRYSEAVLENAFVHIGGRIAAVSSSTATRPSRFEAIFARHRRVRLERLVMLVTATALLAVMFAV